MGCAKTVGGDVRRTGRHGGPGRGEIRVAYRLWTVFPEGSDDHALRLHRQTSFGTVLASRLMMLS